MQKNFKFVDLFAGLGGFPVQQVPTVQNPLTEAPQTLQQALQLFLLGAAHHSVTRGKGNRSMMVHQFVEVLSSLSLPSSRAVAGLWAELWLMCVAANRQEAIAAWHGDSTDRFDFSFPGHFVEVKATEREERSHEFSYEQLRRSELPVRVASLRLRRAQSGKSVADLVVELQAGQGPDLRAKLVKNVFSAIGSAVSEVSEIRFDESFAGANLRVIAGEKVPVVVIPDGSPISAVRFRVNLGDSSLAADLTRPASHAALDSP